MKLIEAFDSSAPQWIKDFLSSRLRTFKPNTYANNLQDIDASTAKFINVSNESVSELRKRLKSGTDLLFVLYKVPERRFTVPIIIRYDADNTSNGLRVIGSSEFRYTSFKQIIENAAEVWYTKITEERKNKRRDRADSRRGGIFRDKDNVVDPDLYANVNLDTLRKDASGYTYDSKRLVKKLVDIHENDSAYTLNKATKIFSDMVNSYTNKLSEFVTNKNYSSNYNDKSGFRYISRMGQQILEDSIRIMDRLNDFVESSIETLEDYSQRYRDDFDEEPPENIENRYNSYQKRIKREILKSLSELSNNKEQLNSVINGN